MTNTESRLEAVDRERLCALHGGIADKAMQRREICRLQFSVQFGCEGADRCKGCEIEIHRFNRRAGCRRLLQRLNCVLRT